MLTYDMSKREKIPAYQYLYHCIKDDILSGSLLPNEKLPSKRSLSTHLGVSVVTVMSAYELLVSEGYLYTKPKSGYFVVPIKTQQKVTNFQLSEFDFKEFTPWFDFSGNATDSSDFPFSVWSKLMRKTLLDYESELLNPIPYNGAEILREALCQYLFHHSGMKVYPEQIIIGAGAEYLYSVIIRLVGSNKTYALENPGYNRISQIYQMNEVATEYIDVDNKGISYEKLKESNASVVHISPSHQYPTGIVMPVDRRNEILNWADENDGYIIEDDYDSEFKGSKPIETMFSADKNERVLYLNTFSKTIAPSMRIGYLVLPLHLLKKYRETMNFLSCTVPSFEQYTLANFISDGYFERHISRMKKQYSSRKKEIMDVFKNSEIKNKITIVENMSGFHFLVKINTEKSDEQFIKELKEKNINARFLSQYYHKENKDCQHFMIVNYSGIQKEKLEKAIEILGEII